MIENEYSGIVDSQLDPYQPSVGVDPDTTDEAALLKTKSYLEPSAMSTVRLEMVAAQVSPRALLPPTWRFGVRIPRRRHKSIRFVSRMTTLFRSGLRSQTWCDPPLQLATINRGVVVVHGAAVELQGRPRGLWLVVYGKTETALALAELGARFISEKAHGIDSDARIHAFPVSACIRDWVLDYVPRLRARLRRYSGRGRAFLTARRALPSSPEGGASPRRRRGVTARTRAHAQRRLSLRQTEVAAIYGSAQDPTATPPLCTLAMLTTVPGKK